MTPHGATTLIRRVPPSHKPWNAHPYQAQAVKHLLSAHAAALFLDPGLGKTSIVLKAFDTLRAGGRVKSMLVIAPLRVCQTVWRQEGQKWTDFRHLSFSLLHGSKKDTALKAPADVYLINPEGVAWLTKKIQGRSLGVLFDIVTIDELTKFKNSQSVRSKALRKVIRGVKARWGLTGSPAPNGYMDLFGQFLVLDDGAALGRFITKYRDDYFQLGYDGFTYDLMMGADKRIEARIAPYVLRMSHKDYLQLPPLIPDPRYLEMEPGARKLYNDMAKTMVSQLPGGVVTAGNSAAAYSKLKQMANGAVYDTNHKYEELHRTKIEAVEDLLEELSGQQLLLAYEFNHDIERLTKHFGSALVVLPSGATERVTQEIVNGWNSGKIRFLACHPASAAHGLNLQESACAHIAWFCPIWDLELYQQFLQRVWRQGTTATRIVNHMFIMRDTLDEEALDALSDKDTSQSRLLNRLNAILHGAENPAAGGAAETRSQVMALKMSREAPGVTMLAPPQVQQAQPGAAAASGKIQPKGWGKPAATETVAGTEGQAQSERTHALLTTGGLPEGATAFSQGVQEHMRAIAGETAPFEPPHHEVAHETGAPAPVDRMAEAGQVVKLVDAPEKQTRRRRAQVVETVTDDAAEVPQSQSEVMAQNVRLLALQMSWGAADGDVQGAIEAAKVLTTFILTGA